MIIKKHLCMSIEGALKAKINQMCNKNKTCTINNRSSSFQLIVVSNDTTNTYDLFFYHTNKILKIQEFYIFMFTFHGQK